MKKTILFLSLLLSAPMLSASDLKEGNLISSSGLKKLMKHIVARNDFDRRENAFIAEFQMETLWDNKKPWPVYAPNPQKFNLPLIGSKMPQMNVKEPSPWPTDILLFVKKKLVLAKYEGDELGGIIRQNPGVNLSFLMETHEDLGMGLSGYKFRKALFYGSGSVGIVEGFKNAFVVGRPFIKRALIMSLRALSRKS